ncbi:MAG: hypothetical protein JRG86_08300 [Deltaproteobacteria bacterium]|jgi:hypothetical protein|nr:hypothetical protein [Deltaproteobacteria bacterium]
MFRARTSAILGILLMLTSASTQLSARELELSVGQRLGWDSNALRVANEDDDRDKDRDGFWEFLPGLTLREARNDELSYTLRYRPRYRHYFDVNGINGWDHTQLARVGWQMTPRDTLSLEQTYTDTRTRRLEGGDADVDPSDRDRVKRARVDSAYTHAFTPRVSGQLGFNFEDYQFDSRDRIDNWAAGGSVGTNYAFHERTILGLTFFGRYRKNRGDGKFPQRVGGGTQPSSKNYLANLAASVSQAITPTIDLFFQIGPSIIHTDPDGTPTDENQITSDGSQTDVSFFTTSSLVKRFRLGELRGSYNRTESGGAGAIASQIRDAVDLEAMYRPYPDWTLRLIYQWSQQDVAQDLKFFSPTSNDFVSADERLRRNRALVILDHRFTDNISAYVRFDYTDQRQKEPRRAGAEIKSTTNQVQIYSGFVGVEYTFDPWVF